MKKFLPYIIGVVISVITLSIGISAEDYLSKYNCTNFPINTTINDEPFVSAGHTIKFTYEIYGIDLSKVDNLRQCKFLEFKLSNTAIVSVQPQTFYINTRNSPSFPQVLFTNVSDFNYTGNNTFKFSNATYTITDTINNDSTHELSLYKDGNLVRKKLVQTLCKGQETTVKYNFTYCELADGTKYFAITPRNNLAMVNGETKSLYDIRYTNFNLCIPITDNLVPTEVIPQGDLTDDQIIVNSYLTCPSCKSKDVTLTRTGYDLKNGGWLYKIKCNSCGNERYAVFTDNDLAYIDRLKTDKNSGFKITENNIVSDNLDIPGITTNGDGTLTGAINGITGFLSNIGGFFTGIVSGIGQIFSALYSALPSGIGAVITLTFVVLLVVGIVKIFT